MRTNAVQADIPVIPATSVTTNATFNMTNKKLYVQSYCIVITLSTQDNTKLLQKLETDFKITINWNNYRSEMTIKLKILISTI